MTFPDLDDQEIDPYADVEVPALPETEQPELPSLATRTTLALDELPPERQVPVSAIAPGTKRADPDMVRNVEAVGVLQPVVLQEQHNGLIRILFGERRVDAARRAGLASVPARVYRASAVVDADVLALIENWMRRPNFARELRSVANLVERGYKASRISKDLGGKPIGTVKRYVRLCALPKVLLDAAIEGKLTQTLATEIIKLPVPEREALAALYAAQGKLTADDVRARREVSRRAAQAALPDALFGDEDDLSAGPGTTTTPGGIRVSDERRAVAVGLTAGDVQRLVARLDPAADADLRERLEAALFSQAG